MNLYELASQDEAWGAFTLDDNDDTTPLSAWPADPPASMPPGPVPLDAALDAAAREYGVDADVLRALGHGGSVDSIFGTAASLRSRLEAFDGDYAQALASYRRDEEGNAGDALAAPAAAPLAPATQADAQVPAPGPARASSARPQASTPVPGSPPSQAARPDQPPAPPDGRLGAADDPRSLLYRQTQSAQKPLVDAASSQPGRGTDAASFAPVRPEVRQALGNAWDAASPAERQRMQSMPGWQGQLARERAAQYAQADKGVLAASPTAALLDGRAENRAKAPPATGAAPRAGGNGRAQSQTALRSTTPAGAAEPAPLPQRSWGEAISDATKSAAQGILDVASLPGVAYSAVTGDYETSYLNAIRGTQEVLQDEKSPAFQAQAQALQQKLATAEGWREKLAVGGWETLKNPTLLGDTLARSAPGMLAGGLLGRAAGGVADAAGNALLGRTIGTGSEAAAKSAVALKNAAPAIASGTAVGAAAAQQGASVANDLYAELRKLPASAFAAEPEFQQLAREHGPDKARDILAAAATTRALLVGTGASVLSMKLVPGGDAIEKMFLPSHLKGGAAREAVKSSSFLTQPLTRGMQGNLGTQALEIAVQGLKHGTTGSLSEGTEDASGAVAKGLELSRAGQDVKLSDMAGEAAGQAMAAGFATDGAAGTRRANAAPRVQDQPTWPSTPPASPPPTATTMARGQTAPEAPTAPAVPPPPSPAVTLAAALLPGYSEALQPGNGATWSDAASATRKTQAETEMLRQAEALPAQEVATNTATASSAATPSAAPAVVMSTAMDSIGGSTRQGADASPQAQVNSNAGQADATAAADPAAHGPGAPAPTPSAVNGEADASAAAAETAPTSIQHGSARHTAAAQVQVPAPIETQVQALDSGMLVVGGDQATILAHLQAGGVRGAEPFAGVTLVPVDQAALAQRVLSRPLAAPAGTQADRGSQPASATATLPGTRTAAQLAPATARTPTAGDFTAGLSAVGADAPRTGHGSQANAGALQPVPVMEMQRDGTLMVKGDPAQLQERLRQGGVDRVLRRKGGVLVGLDQVDKARQLLGAPQPHPAQISEGADTTAGSPPINALHASSVAFESPSATSVASSSDDAQRESRIQEQARILQGAPVAVLKGNEAPHGYPLLRDWAVRLFQGFGNKATNREIGQVVLDERSVRDSMAHRMNPYKAVAFAAARQVVEHGALVLSAQHSRDTTGHFISAPVSIAGVENIVTVLVRTTPNSQRMYLHSAITKESLLKSGNSGADTVDGVERSGKATSGDVASVLRRLLTVNVEVPVASISKPAPRNATSKFSTHSGNHAPGLSLEHVQELVQQALSGLRNPPPVDVVGCSEEAWIGAPEGVMGAALPEEGRIVIVASAHQNADAVAETLFHEMFHLGVRNVLPSRDYVQSMLDLAKRDRRVQQYAIEWKAKAPDAPHQLRVLRERGFTGTELTAQYEALAIEEGLAVVAEELRAQKLAGTRLGMRIRTLANWLASVADRMGMGRLAASIRAMSYNEAERFVMRAIDQAGAVGAETSHTGQTRFSTRSAQDPSAALQTDDKNDGTQIHSMRVETQRDGTLMVRGDPTQLQERLRQGGVDRVLRRKGGVVVGLEQVHKARQLLSNPQPTQDRSRTAPPTSALTRREVAPSQGDFVAESYRSGYSDANGRAQEPTQPDDGRGPTTGRSSASTADSVRGAGDAVPPRTATLVGLGIAKRIERTGSQSLVGQQVDSPARLAELAQVYRDPRFETFRVFFMKDGQVVHATGVSARLPGETPMVPAGMTHPEYYQEFRDNMQRTGADGYYVLHNHPSGNPTPSGPDLELTKTLAAHVPGLLAHVVINSNRYAVIDAANQGREPADMVRYQDFGEDRLLKASKPMAVLGERIAGSDDLAIVGKSMQRPGWITLIGTGSDGKVRAISEAPASILTRSYPYLAATVRRFMRQSGSGSVFAVGDAGDIGSKPVRDALAAGILRDALPDAGRTLHQQGVHTGGTGFSLTRGRRVAEGEPGSSAPSAVSMHTQRDGTLMVKGDPAELRDRLRGGGVDSLLLREGGVVVGLDQVGKARQLLQQQPPRAQTSAGPSPTGQQFSRSAPDQASRANNLPSKPATVQSVKAAVAKLTNSMGLLAEGRGRVVVATSADIQAHWEPLVGKVDMGSQDTGLAQGFYDPHSKTVFLIADHIEAGQEMAVAAHELVHKHGKAVLGEAGWRQLHQVIGSWATRPEGSLERLVYDEAAARVQASRPDSADAAAYSSEELFPYAVHVAMEMGVQPTALMPNNSVQGWLARVRAALRSVFKKLTKQPGLFDSQDLVNLAWGIAQRENPEHVRELDAIWTEVPGDVQAVIDSARQPGHAPQKAVLGEVSEWLAYEAAIQAGINIAGFTHVLDGSAARHMLNRHTNPAIEKSRGQIALTDADILAASQVIGDPDLVVLGTKTQGHKDQIVYLKRLDDGAILYLEEVPTGRREMAAMSMRKYPAAKDFSDILATLPSNARSGGRNTGQIVLVPPQTGKRAGPPSPMFSRQPRPEVPKITKSGVKPDDSVLVNGSPDIWTIPAEVETRTKGDFPSAPVRLKNGFHRGPNRGFGVAHIEAEHAADIQATGLSVPQYVQHILGNATKIYDPGNGRLLVVNERFAGKHLAIIELRDDGDHYSVVTAFAKRPEGKVVWSGRSSSAGLPGAKAPLATGKTESFDSTPAIGSSADPSAVRDDGEPQAETPKPSPSSRIAGQTASSLPED